MSVAALLELLSDGQVHSGVKLAHSLNVSRAAVWKSIERLRQRGIFIRSQARSGYVLDAPVEMLGSEAIRAALSPAALVQIESLQVDFEVDSTNTRLLLTAPAADGRAHVRIAELQSAGRGRRGRPWVGAFGHSLMMSLSWNFSHLPPDLSALSLAAGVAVVRALQRFSARDLGLKWPNDLWYQQRKLGGLLIEMRAETSGPAFVVIGLGLNTSLSAALAREIENAGTLAASLAECGARPCSRNDIAAAVIEEWLTMLTRFSSAGFAPFRDAWRSLDVLLDQPVRTSAHVGELSGIARGVDDAGRLIVDVDGVRHLIVSGETTLRRAVLTPCSEGST